MDTKYLKCSNTFFADCMQLEFLCNLQYVLQMPYMNSRNSNPMVMHILLFFLVWFSAGNFSPLYPGKEFSSKNESSETVTANTLSIQNLNPCLVNLPFLLQWTTIFPGLFFSVILDTQGSNLPFCSCGTINKYFPKFTWYYRKNYKWVCHSLHTLFVLTQKFIFRSANYFVFEKHFDQHS